MAIALKTTVRTVWLAAIVMIGATGGVCAAEAEEADEESYYLSQMRDLANSKKGQPAVEEAPASSNELMAETDLEKMAKAAAEIDEIDEVTPSLNKPSLPALKPEL